MPVGVSERRRRVERPAGRGVALRVALVEQRRDLVGIEFRLLLLRRLLRRQRLLDLGLLFRLRSGCLDLVGDRIGLGLAAARAGGCDFLGCACTSFFSVIFGFESSTGLGGSSAFFSTSGLGVSTLGASFTPLVISEKSFSLTRSTGSDSVGVDVNVLPENEIVAHSSTAACRPAEIAVAFLITAL